MVRRPVIGINAIPTKRREWPSRTRKAVAGSCSGRLPFCLTAQTVRNAISSNSNVPMETCQGTSVWPIQCSPSATRSKIFNRSEEHTSELQSLMRNSYAVFCLKKTQHTQITTTHEKHKNIKHKLSH